ncbi:hypothetical protein ABIB57_002278 [Devosia sp. UYZn731]|uniref:hypothetical protein n=1 Tax=Devosia sp. UYZn731 TaxID=3156345 RepID=UPI0033935E10
MTSEKPADEAASGKTRSKSKRKPPSGGGDAGNKSVVLDAELTANKIKTDQRFSAIKTKILDVGNEWISKCKLVALVSGEPVTSGDVYRVLTQLRIKSALSTLSKTLSGNSTDFLTTGSNPVKYELTAAAQQAFEKWLADA